MVAGFPRCRFRSVGMELESEKWRVRQMQSLDEDLSAKCQESLRIYEEMLKGKDSEIRHLSEQQGEKAKRIAALEGRVASLSSDMWMVAIIGFMVMLTVLGVSGMMLASKLSSDGTPIPDCVGVQLNENGTWSPCGAD